MCRGTSSLSEFSEAFEHNAIDLGLPPEPALLPPLSYR